MNDLCYYNKAISRYLAVTHDKCDRQTNEFYENVIVFLEKEIDRYREKIDGLNGRISTMYGELAAEEAKKKLDEWEKGIEQRVKIIDEFSLSIGKGLQELSNKHDALNARVDQLGQIVENKMDQVLSDTVQTLTEFTTEQISDGGIMTLDRKTTLYTQIVDKLMLNGYFVCTHFNDYNETITIEFWRA